jgi:hypothetical protein
LLDLGAIKITQKVWHGKIETVKSKKGVRTCEISSQLVEHLRGYFESVASEQGRTPLRIEERNAVGC